MNEVFKTDTVRPAGPAQPSPSAPDVEPPRPPAAPRRHRWLRWAFGLLVLLAAATFAWRHAETPAPTTSLAPSTREGRGPGGRDSAPQTVRVASVVSGDMQITLDALGTVTPFGTVTVRTQIAGKLMEVGFEEGQTVKKGDFLAQIDPRPYQASLDQAKGQLAKDQATLTQAQSDLARYETLNKQDSIAKQTVTSQQALVAQDSAAIVVDQAQIETAQINLDYTRITSPIAGRAGLRLVDPGNYLQASDATGVVVITEMDPISVIFTTPEDNLQRVAARLKSGAKLEVTAFDRANVKKLATGTLTTYDSQVDVTTGTIRMRATFDNPDWVLFPNQFVNVRLLVDTLTGVALAPNPAVQVGPSGDFVYLLNADGTVSRRDVAVGPTDGKMTTITQGLASGDRVVIDGVDRLKDGVKVRIVGDAAPGAAAADKTGGGAGGGHHLAVAKPAEAPQAPK